jgi:glycosyltransferase involved in cell wall biosynthesis
MLNSQQSPPAVLYFGNDWFAENRTSSHQIARRLARDYRVYYIECPGLRAPKGSGRDLKKVWAKLVRFAQGARPVGDGLKVRTLLQVPLHRFALVRWLNRALIIATLRWLMWREGIRRPVTWFMIPHLSSVVGELGERLSVYYCIDDYAALPDVNPDAIRAMDEELTRKADLVFVASDTLLGPKRELNPETRVSPHGVDLEHFARTRDDRTPVPADAADLPRPVVGFFGLIERWIDLELVDYLAEQRPGWTFLMIGRVAIPDDQIPRRHNIHFLGKRPYDDLPAYGRVFDAAIIPYRLTRQVLHANPIKLREYLAMGKPVVSVSTPEIDKYADVVQIANSREDFLSKLDAVLARQPAPEEIRWRTDRVAAEGWDARLQEVLGVINDRLDGPSSRPEPSITTPLFETSRCPS